MSFKGKKNIYTCDKCNAQAVTIDRDEGVTPFTMRCKVTLGCHGTMYSKCYRVDQNTAPEWEWYKPGSAVNLDPGSFDHVSRGGLLLRRITN